jgi:hypothetical protein
MSAYRRKIAASRGLLAVGAAWSAAPALAAEVRPGQARAIEVDGRLDEEAWSVAPIDGFRQHLPAQDGPTPGATEVRFLQDRDYLYVGVRVVDGHQRPEAWLTARDDATDRPPT